MQVDSVSKINQTVSGVKPPRAIEVIVEGIPDEPKTFEQWVCWMYERRESCWTKVPINPKTGQRARVNDKTSWASFKEAHEYFLKGTVDGLGFVLTPNDPYCVVDFDKCAEDGEDGTTKVHKYHQEMNDQDSYTEVSPSGKGTHTWLKATLPEGAKLKNDKAGIECYDRDRYICVTGQILDEEKPIREAGETFRQFHEKYLGTVEVKKAQEAPETARSPSQLSDEEIIEKAKAAKNGADFSGLWAGDNGRSTSDSGAVGRLLKILAFWTRDESQIDRLFRRSGMFKNKWANEKWDRLKDEWIQNALNWVTNSYSGSSSGSAADKPKKDSGVPWVCAKDIVGEKRLWLWKGWLSKGELIIFDGLPGVSKSTFTVDIAARVTQGWKMPPNNDRKPSCVRPRNVVMVSGEDSWELTIVHRLNAAGADMSRIFKLEDLDLDNLTRTIEEKRPSMVIVDPILGFFEGKNMDMNTETDVRAFLKPLVGLARKYNLAMVLIRHFKKEGGAAVHRGLGAQGWTALCRLQHVVGMVEGYDNVVLALGKGNCGQAPRSLAYSVESTIVQCPRKNRPGQKDDVEIGQIRWLGEVDYSANEVARGAETHRRGRPSVQKEAEEIITDFLIDGPKTVDHIKSLVQEQLVIGDTVFKAAMRAVTTGFRDGFGPGGKCMRKLKE